MRHVKPLDLGCLELMGLVKQKQGQWSFYPPRAISKPSKRSRTNLSGDFEYETVPKRSRGDSTTLSFMVQIIKRRITMMEFNLNAYF